MKTEGDAQLMDRGMLLEDLQRRLQARMSPTGTVKVIRPAEVSLLRALSPEELKEFARRCHANVVPRAGGSEYEFSGAVVPPNP